MEPATLPCPNWVIATWSNCHLAKDRAWFGNDYQRIDSVVHSIGGRAPVPVSGIGTVLLPVKTSLKAKGPSSHGTLRLANVLHVPTWCCNLIGTPVLEDFTMEWLPWPTKYAARLTHPGTGKIAALFVSGAGEFSSFKVVKLSGYPVGPKTAPPKPATGGHMMVPVNWPQSQHDAWVKRIEAKSSAPTVMSSLDEEPMRLTPEENQWLKEHYGGEVKFLLTYGLSIYKEEDRQEGCSILRALRNDDEDEDLSTQAKETNYESKALAADSPLEHCGNTIRPSAEQKLWLKQHAGRKWQGHIADNCFSSRELAYIQREWGNSSSLMYYLDLNPYNASDCQDAKQLVAAFMNAYDESDVDLERSHLDRMFSKKALYYINRLYGSSTKWMDIMGFDPDKKKDCREARLLSKEEHLLDKSEEDDGSEISILSYINAGRGVAGPRQLAEHFLPGDELDFVNQTYGNSLSFMICFGLKFYAGEDCQKARSIATLLLGKPAEPEIEEGEEEEEEEEEDDDDEDKENEEDEDDDDDDDEANWVDEEDSSVFSDELCYFLDREVSFFTPAEEMFMSQECGSTELFMLSYGLKFYKDEDCEEAKAIIRVLRHGYW